MSEAFVTITFAGIDDFFAGLHAVSEIWGIDAVFGGIAKLYASPAIAGERGHVEIRISAGLPLNATLDGRARFDPWFRTTLLRNVRELVRH
jgi:hypothetical protein